MIVNQYEKLSADDAIFLGALIKQGPSDCRYRTIRERHVAEIELYVHWVDR